MNKTDLNALKIYRYLRERELSNKSMKPEQTEIEIDLKLSPYKQRAAVARLQDLGLLRMDREGWPRRYIYKVVDPLTAGADFNLEICRTIRADYENEKKISFKIKNGIRRILK